MGWFSNPKCPRCGKETSIVRDMFESYYTCHGCVAIRRKELKEKEELENRILRLEELLKEKK